MLLPTIGLLVATASISVLMFYAAFKLSEA